MIETSHPPGADVLVGGLIYIRYLVCINIDAIADLKAGVSSSGG